MRYKLNFFYLNGNNKINRLLVSWYRDSWMATSWMMFTRNHKSRSSLISQIIPITKKQQFPLMSHCLSQYHHWFNSLIMNHFNLRRRFSGCETKIKLSGESRFFNLILDSSKFYQHLQIYLRLKKKMKALKIIWAIK